MKSVQHIKRNKLKKNNLSLDKKELLESAKIASSKAVRSSKALGLIIKVIKNHKIIEIHPDHSKNTIRSIPKPIIDLTSLKKGMVLKRK